MLAKWCVGELICQRIGTSGKIEIQGVALTKLVNGVDSTCSRGVCAYIIFSLSGLCF